VPLLEIDPRYFDRAVLAVLNRVLVTVTKSITT